MKQLQLHFYLHEPVIFSEASATTGGHRSLDYIPGSAIMGACASQLYTELESETFAVFHEGKVRFSNAYPLTENHCPSYPMPFSLHYAKGTTAHEKRGADEFLATESVFNLSRTDEQKLPDGKQAKQLRSGYITDNLRHLTTYRQLRMKTAIDPKTARAAEAQLFAYQSLEAGQCFSGSVMLDDSIRDDTINKIRTHLNGDLFLGRSRSAEYGKVNCQAVQHSPVIAPIKNTSELTLWLQSDLLLNNSHGMPVTTESLPAALLTALLAESVKDQKAQIDWRRSYLRYRNYSPYNAYRQAYDMERQVIEKGSVIYLTLSDPITLPRSHVSIGQYQAQGLGHVWINPPLLTEQHPVANSADAFEFKAHTTKTVKTPDALLVHYLMNQQQHQQTERSDRILAEKSGKQLKQLYANARSFAGVDHSILLGPSATQWGRVAEAGKQYQSNKQALFSTLFNAEDAICHPQDEAWGVASFDQNKNEITFANWLRRQLDNDEIKQRGHVAAIIARMAQDEIKQFKQRGKA